MYRLALIQAGYILKPNRRNNPGNEICDSSGSSTM